LLQYIGEVYKERANYESNIFGQLVTEVYDSAGSVATNCQIASAGIQAAASAAKIHSIRQIQERRKQTPNSDTLSSEEIENEKNKLFERSKSIQANIITCIWFIARIDIKSTLCKVCRKVTHDRSVSSEKRALRTKAIFIIGEIYESVGAKTAAKLNDFIDKMGIMIPKDTGFFFFLAMLIFSSSYNSFSC
jgi:hypothetical protein